MITWRGIPCLTAEEMRLMDILALGKYQMSLLAMMENAGISLALLVKRMLGGLQGKRIICLAGKGNNGGGGTVAARHLHNWGADVEVVLSERRENLREATALQLNILQRMQIQVKREASSGKPDLLIDAMLGYNAKGNPREPIASLIGYANQSKAFIVALDLPSGLDPDTGKPYAPCIKATATLTLALPKTGLVNPEAKTYIGKLYLADIGIPRALYREVTGSDPGFFARGPTIRLM